ncbi:MAG: AAA family ATPase [Pseudomonadota bacterium]
MNNTKVKKLKITNFKGIKNLELDLTYQKTDKILDNIIIYGINGTGKSTILEAIYICLTVGAAYHKNNNLTRIEEFLVDYISLGSEWIYNHEKEFRIDIQILDNQELISATLEYHQKNGLKWQIQNNLSLEIQNSFTYLSSYRLLNPSTVQSAGDWNKIDRIEEALFKSRERYSDSVRYRKFDNNYRTVKQYLVNLITDKKVETLTSKNRAILEKIKESFKIFFPQKVFLEQLSRTEETKDYRLMIKNEDGSIVDLDQLSSGEREVVAFFTYLCTKATNNSILIIDEPELHLHSKWQSIILYAIHQLFPNSQLFLATHSKEIHQSSSESELFELEKGE